jgi:hypothetical protein
MQLYEICKTRRHRETGRLSTTVVQKGFSLEYVREFCSRPESSSDHKYNPRAKYDWFFFYRSM